MKCTDKKYRKSRKRRNRKRELCIRLSCSSALLLTGIIVIMLAILSRNPVTKHEVVTYNTSVHQASLYADELCVTKKDVEFEAFQTKDKFSGALLFDIENQEILYSEKANEKLYPASVTKIMTAYLALKYGELGDYVTISENAVDVPSDSSSARLQQGDILTLEDLLYALMLPSGNDSAIAIAEHISGSEESFVELMNKEANSIGATNTHFVNSHGYHDDKHYTTAYDLYLIFQECIKNETFLQIIASTSWETLIKQADGTTREAIWPQSNLFMTNGRSVPKGITLFGGKTGNTNDAGSCILLYGQDSKDTPFIAIIMGASSRRNLYDNMTFLLDAIE